MSRFSFLVLPFFVAASAFGATQLTCSDKGFRITFESKSVTLAHASDRDAYFRANEMNVHNDAKDRFPSFSAVGKARFPRADWRGRPATFEGRAWLHATPLINREGRVEYKLTLQAGDDTTGGYDIFPVLTTTKCQLAR